MLQWTLVSRCLSEFLPSVLLGMYPEVEFLGHVVILCLVFEELPNSFPKWLHHFIFLPARCETSSCSTSWLTPGISGLFNVCLFLWLCWVLVVAHRIFVASCGILSCGIWTLSWGTQTLSCCSMWDLVSCPWIELGAHALEELDHQGSPYFGLFKASNYTPVKRIREK